MELAQVVREALEQQVLDQEPEQAATTLGSGVSAHGPVAIAGALVDAAAVALRRMVASVDEAYDQADLLSRLALDGAIPEHRLELLAEMLTVSAATAGGIRPPVDALGQRLGDQDLLFGAWLGLITTVRIVSITLEQTEAEVVEDIVHAFETF
jgi:type III secretion system FlhB-like substrate exporter